MQYVRGFDHSGRSAILVAEAAEKVCPTPGQILDGLRIVMLPCARIQGRIVDDKGMALTEKEARCTLTFADGVQGERRIRTDAEGRFHLDRLTPGFTILSVEMGSIRFEHVIAEPLELRPGQTRDVGDITLKGGLNKQQIVQDKHIHAMQCAPEVHLAAQRLFEKIRTAEYGHYLDKGVHWSEFPIVGYYQTHHWFDVLVRWMCTTFKDNPIVNVELGQVFLNPDQINGMKNLPTVPYKLTLKNGARLEGDLPFTFTFDGGEPHWHGLHGIDWHLSSADQK
ncbi:MAG: carboxypeptidase regulatory-like domain-containing protein [Sedimentisphaerales bacterium]|nr:carboxypeptidase regulatory-like domain-containing protein [Sedimentisphaerales bacterium]